MAGDAYEQRLRQLQRYRVPKERDLTLGFMAEQFQREVARPYKQLGALVGLWAELVPAALAAHTRLDRLSRGVLWVAVDSSAHLYELDRLLRAGLERELIQRHNGAALRRVRLQVTGAR